MSPLKTEETPIASSKDQAHYLDSFPTTHSFLKDLTLPKISSVLTSCLIAAVILSSLPMSALFTNIYLFLLNHKIKHLSALLLTHSSILSKDICLHILTIYPLIKPLQNGFSSPVSQNASPEDAGNL